MLLAIGRVQGLIVILAALTPRTDCGSVLGEKKEQLSGVESIEDFMDDDGDFDINDIGSQNDCINPEELQTCLDNCEDKSNRDCQKQLHDMKCYGVCTDGCRYIEENLDEKCILTLMSHIKGVRDDMRDEVTPR